MQAVRVQLADETFDSEKQGKELLVLLGGEGKMSSSLNPVECYDDAHVLFMELFPRCSLTMNARNGDGGEGHVMVRLVGSGFNVESALFYAGDPARALVDAMLCALIARA